MVRKKAKIKKGKKPHKNKKTSKKYSKYKIEGDKVFRERVCPRCGPGIFLMIAKDRVYCGKCHYSEFKTGQKEVVEEPNNPKVIPKGHKTRGPEEKKEEPKKE